MYDEEVFRRISAVLSAEFELDPESITPEATLFDQLGLDSLDAVDMVVALEKEFGVKMRDEEAMRAVRSVDDLYQLVMKTGEQTTQAAS